MKIIVDEKKRIADMIKNCHEARDKEWQILVDREDLQRLKDTLDCYFNYEIASEGRHNSVFDAREIVSKLLDTNITDEDREWADKHIMLKEFLTFINKAKQTHPKIAGARVNCINNKNGFNPATVWLTDYVEIKGYVKGFIEGTNNSGDKIKSIDVEIITNYAEKELHLKLKE